MPSNFILSRGEADDGLPRRLGWFPCAKETIISFTAPSKMKFEGIVGDQNLLEHG